MKRYIAVIIALAFAVSMSLFTGCGGKSQKINGVADEESQVMDEAKQSEKESLPSAYTVASGDTLWGIAKKAEIYGNDQQWPLIYDANRDILDDYKKPLEEGQKLIIPRNISAVDIEQAKEKAKEYGMPGGSGSRVASAGGEEAKEDAQNNVAGMGEGASGNEASVAGRSPGSTGSSVEGSSGEPTPIPEPNKPRKNGKGNMMPLLLLALLGVIVIIIFVVSRQKKKEDEEEEKGEGETKTNILD